MDKLKLEFPLQLYHKTRLLGGFRFGKAEAKYFLDFGTSCVTRYKPLLLCYCS